MLETTSMTPCRVFNVHFVANKPSAGMCDPYDAKQTYKRYISCFRRPCPCGSWQSITSNCQQCGSNLKGDGGGGGFGGFSFCGPSDSDSTDNNCPACGYNNDSATARYTSQMQISLAGGSKVQLRTCRPVPTRPDTDKECLTLCAAVEASSVVDIRSFLELGTDVNQPDDEGLSPLMHATSPAIVQLLIRKGADPALVDADGATALSRCLEKAASKKKKKRETKSAFGVTGSTGETTMYDPDWVPLEGDAVFYCPNAYLNGGGGCGGFGAVSVVLPPACSGWNDASAQKGVVKSILCMFCSQQGSLDPAKPRWKCKCIANQLYSCQSCGLPRHKKPAGGRGFSFGDDYGGADTQDEGSYEGSIDDMFGQDDEEGYGRESLDSNSENEDDLPPPIPRKGATTEADSPKGEGKKEPPLKCVNCQYMHPKVDLHAQFMSSCQISISLGDIDAAETSSDSNLKRANSMCGSGGSFGGSHFGSAALNQLQCQLYQLRPARKLQAVKAVTDNTLGIDELFASLLEVGGAMATPDHTGHDSLALAVKHGLYAEMLALLAIPAPWDMAAADRLANEAAVGKEEEEESSATAAAAAGYMCAELRSPPEDEEEIVRWLLRRFAGRHLELSGTVSQQEWEDRAVELAMGRQAGLEPPTSTMPPKASADETRFEDDCTIFSGNGRKGKKMKGQLVAGNPPTTPSKAPKAKASKSDKRKHWKKASQRSSKKKHGRDGRKDTTPNPSSPPEHPPAHMEIGESDPFNPGEVKEAEDEQALESFDVEVASESTDEACGEETASPLELNGFGDAAVAVPAGVSPPPVHI